MEIVPVTKNVTITRGVTHDAFLVVLKDSDGNQIDIQGWNVYGQVRKKPKAAILYDLAPTIVPTSTDVYGTTGPGRIILGAYTDEETLAMTDAKLVWDTVVEDPDGARFGPASQGQWNIITIVTEPS